MLSPGCVPKIVRNTPYGFAGGYKQRGNEKRFPREKGKHTQPKGEKKSAQNVATQMKKNWRQQEKLPKNNSAKMGFPKRVRGN